MWKHKKKKASSDAEMLTKEAKEQYEKLVEDVRMRQHELGNQLSAVKGFSAGEKTEKYLDELNRDQMYGRLLLCGDPLLAGVLYQKCAEVQKQGIGLEVHVAARLEDTAFLQHDLIAVVGVLMDNALEAELTRPAAERFIRITLDEEDGLYRIMVANRFPYVTYRQMGKWFETGHSSKGEGRGLGLSHVRKLCAKNGADIVYGNHETGGENEVFFMLYLGKQEKITEEEMVSQAPEETIERTAPQEKENIHKRKEIREEESERKDFRTIEKSWGENRDRESGREKESVTAGIQSRIKESSTAGKNSRAWESGGSGKNSRTRENSRYSVDIGNTTKKSRRIVMVTRCVCLLIVVGIAAALTIHLRKLQRQERYIRQTAQKIEIAYTKELADDYFSRLSGYGLPESPKPFELYDEAHVPEEADIAGSGSDAVVKLPEPDIWEDSAADISGISFDFYDENGNCTGRETYHASNMDSSAERREMVEREQQYSSFPTGHFYRRRLERWEYDDSGRPTSYRLYVQYGETLDPELIRMDLYRYDEFGSQTVSMELSENKHQGFANLVDNNDSILHIEDRNNAGQILREYEIDREGNLLWITEYEYDKQGYPLTDPEGNWVWDEAHQNAKLADCDYYGEEYISVWEYDDAGRKLSGYYLEDGVYHRGYEALYDERGNLVEEYDGMPVLQRERLSDVYRTNFYDEEHTMPLKPQAYVDHYRYFICDAEGAKTYELDIDAESGYGNLYLYRYDTAGKPDVTWQYYIRGSELMKFKLKTPDGGTLYFANEYYEQTRYEITGSRYVFSGRFLTEISKENAAQKLDWIFTFEKGRPGIRKYRDHAVDWSKEERPAVIP